MIIPLYFRKTIETLQNRIKTLSLTDLQISFQLSKVSKELRHWRAAATEQKLEVEKLQDEIKVLKLSIENAEANLKSEKHNTATKTTQEEQKPLKSALKRNNENPESFEYQGNKENVQTMNSHELKNSIKVGDNDKKVTWTEEAADGRDSNVTKRRGGIRIHCAPTVITMKKKDF